MATQNPVEASHERQHELIERALHKIEGDVVWLKEYFTPDDDDTDRFSRLEGKVGSLEGKVGSLEGKVDSLEGKVDSLEGKVGSLETKVDRILDRLESIEDRLPVVLTQAEFDALESKMDGRLYVVVERAQ